MNAVMKTVSRFSSKSLPVWGTAALGLALAVAVGRIHVRVQTTLVGYEIGRLKGDESKLLEERALLKMQLAKLTTKKHLIMMSESGEGQDAQDTVAAK